MDIWIIELCIILLTSILGIRTLSIVSTSAVAIGGRGPGPPVRPLTPFLPHYAQQVHMLNTCIKYMYNMNM
jgi:hypothetical protein